MGAGASTICMPPPNADVSFCVFLGGSCNPTTWRQDVACPMLERNNVTFYNPQVDVWDESMIEKESKAKEKAKILLFVIDNKTRGYASLVEAAYYIGQGRKVVVVLQRFAQEVNGIRQEEFRDANRGRAFLEDICKTNEIPVYSEVQDAVAYICKMML